MVFVRKVVMSLSAALLSGCIVTTQVVERYDEDCRIHTRHVVLNPAQWGSMGDCRDTSECTSALVGIGVMSAASAVVSGSVVVVGNAIYWLEKQGKCQRKTENRSDSEREQQA